MGHDICEHGAPSIDLHDARKHDRKAPLFLRLPLLLLLRFAENRPPEASRCLIPIAACRTANHDALPSGCGVNTESHPSQFSNKARISKH
eukprot:1804881-Rhodomonas_salina.1